MCQSPRLLVSVVFWNTLLTRNQAPTAIGGSVSGLVAGIDSVLVAGTGAGGGTTITAAGGGGSSAAGRGAGGGGGGAASGVAWAHALPAPNALVKQSVNAQPKRRSPESRPIILFPPSVFELHRRPYRTRVNERFR